MAKEDTIFLLSNEGNLLRVPRCHYESEDLLQGLLEKYPNLLASDQMGGDEPVRFVLVKREAGIPDGEKYCDRWSIDHILLDQYGLPTLVEVKRSSDTRIRREVVGQLLEYAANIEVNWPHTKIRSLALEQHGGDEQLDEAIRELLCLEPECDDAADAIERYWSLVEENCRSGRMRLLFVADEIPKEVRRIIEFLNSKMADVEVLGVELRQYVGSSIHALVPRVIGQTEVTRRKSSRTSAGARTTRDELISSCPLEIQPFLTQLIDRAEQRGLAVYWGEKGISFRAPDQAGKLHSLLYYYPPGVYGSTPFIEGYLARILRGTELGQQLQRSLLGISSYKKSGQYTFRLHLTPENLSSAEQSLDVVWQVAEGIELMQTSE